MEEESREGMLEYQEDRKGLLVTESITITLDIIN